MIHLPKKTYSRRNKKNVKLGSKQNTEVQPAKRDFDVDQTLSEDIWKDSFDRLKDLESVPTPRNRYSDKGFNKRKEFSKECGGSIHSFVSTPKAASKKLEECPMPFSPIESRKYFLSNDYYDSKGNPRRIFEYSSEIGQELLQSVCALDGTDLSYQCDKMKEKLLSRERKVKADKLRDKTNLNTSSINKSKKQERDTRRIKSLNQTGKENTKTCTVSELTKKIRCNSEVKKLSCFAEREQISLRDQKHIEEENFNFAKQSSLPKESRKPKTQNTVSAETLRKSKQKRQPKKRRKSQSGSLDNLNKQSFKEITPTISKRSKQTTQEANLAAIAEPLCSEYLMKQFSELNEISFKSVPSTRKSKQKGSKKPKSNSVGNSSKLPDGVAVFDTSRTKGRSQLISPATHLDTTSEVLAYEQLPLKNMSNSEFRETQNSETINDDDPSQKFEVIQTVEVIHNDDSLILSSPKTPFKTSKPRRSDTANAKKSRTQRKSRKVNRYLPLSFVEIISRKKLGQETILITDDSPSTGILNELRRSLSRKTTENKRKSKTKKPNSKKNYDLELCDQNKNENEQFLNCKEGNISLIKTSFYKDLKTEAREISSGGDSSNNKSLAVETKLHDDLNDRMSFVTRRTRGRQSYRGKRSNPALLSVGEIVDIETENSSLNVSTSVQPKTNKVKWDISPSLNEKTGNISNSLINESSKSSINLQEFLSTISRSAVRSKGRSAAQNEGPPEVKLPVVLQPGKWRKSLSMWRRLNTAYKDKINDSEILPAQNIRFPRQTLMRTFCDDPFNSSLAKSIDQRASTRLGNNSCIYRRKTIIDYEKSTLTLKEDEDIFDVKNTIPEDEYDTSLTCNKSALLLEPTDDESPHQSTLPHFTSISKQNVCTSLRRSQTVCYKDLYSPGDTEYSNETSNERTQRYQHQLSVPLPLYRQPSISRRRRTSIVGLPVPGIGGPICEDDLFTEYVRLSTYEVSLRAQLDAKDIVLRRCGQSEPLNFAEEYSEKVLHQCRKIGEGVYGEVFMNKNFTGETVVLKIIPIEGCIEVNGESQKRFDEILSEIVIAMELSRLRNDKEYTTSGFVEVKKVRCVKGRYPDHLLELWELFRENHGTENDHPEIFTEDQLYIVLELANGGQDLEAFTFQNALQSYSAFVQVALTIAAAECKFQFEHRDLHWGNILLAPTEEKELSFRIAGKEINIPTHGVKATIIDYTLSRMVFDGCCLYNDLSNDNELFSAGGDYQFDIYRFMRKRLEDQWERFEPYTNVLWLHYAIDKMISGARYRYSKSKKHRAAIHDMMQLRDEMLDFKSASDYIECLN